MPVWRGSANGADELRAGRPVSGGGVDLSPEASFGSGDTGTFLVPRGLE